MIKATAPDLVEDLRWRSPTYLHAEGVIMLVMSAHKSHANVAFTPSTHEKFSAELTAYETGNGSIKIRYNDEIPSDVLARMIRYRIREYERDGIKWM